MRLNMASLISKPESFLGSFYKVILDLDVAVGFYEGLGWPCSSPGQALAAEET